MLWMIGRRHCTALFVAVGLVVLGAAFPGAAGAQTAAEARSEAALAEEARREAVRDSLRLEIQRYSDLVRALRDSLVAPEGATLRSGRDLAEVEAAISSLGEAIGSIAEQLSDLQFEIDAGRFSLHDGQGGRVTVDLPPDLGERISQGLASITRVILDEIPDTLRFGDGSTSYTWDWGDRAPPVPPVPPAPERLIRGDVVKFNDRLEIARGEVVEGNVVAILGDVTVEGRIKGDLVVVLGDAILGERAVVDGEVVLVLGRLEREEGARTGAMTVIHPGDGSLLRGLDQTRGSWRAFSAWQTLFVLSSGLVLFVLLLAPRDRLLAVTETLQRRAPASLGLGLILIGLGHGLVLGIGGLLVLTIIGIPVAALALLALALLDLAAIGIGSVAIGRSVCGALGKDCRHPIRMALLGLLVLHVPALLAGFGAAVGMPGLLVLSLVWIGRLCKLAALAAGLGALLLGRFGTAAGAIEPAVEPAWIADPGSR